MVAPVSHVEYYAGCVYSKLGRLISGRLSVKVRRGCGWPRCERRLSPATRQIYRRNFHPMPFIQSEAGILTEFHFNQTGLETLKL